MSDSIYQLKPVTQLFGEDKYQSVENLVTNHRAFVERIPEIGIISFGAIKRATFKRIDLGAKGIVGSVMLSSVYAFSGDTLTDEITFNIYQKTPNLEVSEVRIATEKIRSNEMPYQFPYGAILTNDNIIEIKPNANLDNLFIYVRPVIELFRISADNNT